MGLILLISQSPSQNWRVKLLYKNHNSQLSGSEGTLTRDWPPIMGSTVGGSKNPSYCVRNLVSIHYKYGLINSSISSCLMQTIFHWLYFQNITCYLGGFSQVKYTCVTFNNYPAKFAKIRACSARLSRIIYFIIQSCHFSLW